LEKPVKLFSADVSGPVAAMVGINAGLALLAEILAARGEVVLAIGLLVTEVGCAVSVLSSSGRRPGGVCPSARARAATGQ
jgi:hypothetical protein